KDSVARQERGGALRPAGRCRRKPRKRGRSGRERAGAKRAGKLPVRAGRKAPGMTRDRRTWIAQARVRGPTVDRGGGSFRPAPRTLFCGCSASVRAPCRIAGREPRFHVRSVVCRPDAGHEGRLRTVIARVSTGTIRGSLSAADSGRFRLDPVAWPEPGGLRHRLKADCKATRGPGEPVDARPIEYTNVDGSRKRAGTPGSPTGSPGSP